MRRGISEGFVGPVEGRGGCVVRMTVEPRKRDRGGNSREGQEFIGTSIVGSEISPDG